MANYTFSVDGAETGTVGLNEFAFVYNLDVFDTTDTVTGQYGATLDFEIAGPIDLNLTGYAGITGFSTVMARSATGGVHLAIGQDFFDANTIGDQQLSVIAQSDGNGAVVLDASTLTGYRSVILEAWSDGDNVLTGGAYDDVLSSGAGADHFNGGGGKDTVSYSHSSAAVTVDLVAGMGSGGDAQGDAYTSIENVTGSAFADRLIGGTETGTLAGGDGNDVLIAGSGVPQNGSGLNVLDGGAGDDVLMVGDGSAIYVGGAGIDQLNFQNASSGKLVELQYTYPHDSNIVGIESVYGSRYDDALYGDNGGNVLEGAGGNDVLSGLGGSDVLRGGAGADQLNGGGGDGIDTASYYLSSVGITVDLATGIGHGGDAEGDSLAGIEILSGSQGNDVLTGSAVTDTLQGWNGNDVLRGGAGKDVLTGGAGTDRFVFTALSDSVYGTDADRITDFTHAQGDKIDLSAIDANTALPGDQAFQFIGGSNYIPNHQPGQLRFAITTPTTTTIAGDVDGDGVSDFHIILSGHITPVAGDFVL